MELRDKPIGLRPSARTEVKFKLAASRVTTLVILPPGLPPHVGMLPSLFDLGTH